jgi:hypothetical protein
MLLYDGSDSTYQRCAQTPKLPGSSAITGFASTPPNNPCATAVRDVAQVATMRYFPLLMRQNGHLVNANRCPLRDTFYLF